MFNFKCTVEKYQLRNVILISNKIYKYLYKVLIYATFWVTQFSSNSVSKRVCVDFNIAVDVIVAAQVRRPFRLHNQPEYLQWSRDIVQ
jgi:hypothetical protein